MENQINKSSRLITLYWIISKNGQVYFKNIALLTPQIF